MTTGEHVARRKMLQHHLSVDGLPLERYVMGADKAEFTIGDLKCFFPQAQIKNEYWENQPRAYTPGRFTSDKYYECDPFGVLSEVGDDLHHLRPTESQNATWPTATQQTTSGALKLQFETAHAEETRPALPALNREETSHFKNSTTAILNRRLKSLRKPGPTAYAPQPFHVAISAAHAAVWYDVVGSSSFEWALILEDDVLMRSPDPGHEISQYILDIVEDTKSDFDFIFVGGCSAPAVQRACTNWPWVGKHLHRQPRGKARSRCLSSYIISRRGAEKYLSKVAKHGFQTVIDIDFGRLNNLVIYWNDPVVGYQVCHAQRCTDELQYHPELSNITNCPC